ncbi:hypothetical protein GEV33_005045 [Tenebrio molitor]|uniref:Endonuclease/exonuclease/phosphatase domain-containing protein n=1 Tax=Tenebrio molitor TaxID=7067 RepID=A0A8J6LF73_TENMO|nr:hypothetical protein GEV33_005045 [Tenebrio molitor]
MGWRKRRQQKWIKDKDKGEHKKEETKGRGGVKVLYWNVAGLSRKREEFWAYIRKFEIVGLVETWVEEKNWKKIEKTLPKDYNKEMRTTRRVENTVKKDREEFMLVAGDYNGRIGERGARNWGEVKGDGKRKTKDKVENAEGKRLIEWIEENGWEVLNGNKQGDEEGEMTYVGSRGETDIDYAIVNEPAWEKE